LLSLCLIGVLGCREFRKEKYPGLTLITWTENGYVVDKIEGDCTSVGKYRPKPIIDINNNNIKDSVELINNRFYLKEKKKLLWSSDTGFKVDNYVIGDINNDDEAELVLGLWKKNKYGQELPFWEEKNVEDYGYHIFIYKWQEDDLILIWGSSTIDLPVKEIRIVDINQDKKNELIVLEGSYEKPDSVFAEHISIWRWYGWNFFNDFRSDKGKYKGLDVRIDKEIEKICVRRF